VAGDSGRASFDGGLDRGHRRQQGSGVLLGGRGIDGLGRPDLDEIAQVVSSGNSSTTALAGSTEAEQFHGSLPLSPSNAHSPEALA